MYQRNITSVLGNRLAEKRKWIQVIIGPRQVGKTTAIFQALESIKTPSHYAAADLPAPPQPSWITIQWEAARNKLHQNDKVILVLDEVQKIHQWSTEVKRLWDEDTKLKRNLSVVILGSSSLLIQKGLQESLAGRFEIIYFPHWSWIECRDCFGMRFEEYIYFGGYPGALELIHDENRWRSYVRESLIETAIAKDILLLNRIEKPALLRQLFVLACEYGGQILSYQKILGQLQDAGNTTTLAHYQKLLEAAYLIKGLEKWSGQAIRRRSSSPKWIPLNTALVTALSNRSFSDWRNNPADWGRLVEVAVGAHLVNSGLKNNAAVYYWREANKEVDFVFAQNGQISAIEVKSGKSVNLLEPLAGLDAFHQHNENSKLLLIGGDGIPLQDFFEAPL